MNLHVDRPDQSWDHLWPPYRVKLHNVFTELAGQGIVMTMFEGYRTKERQLYLYGQGRPSFRPYGREGNKVTWVTDPKYHGFGVASDNYPVHNGQMIWGFTPAELAAYHAAMKRQGLVTSALSKGDFGHNQMPITDADRVKIAAWIAAGFPQEGLWDPRVPVNVAVNGVSIAEIAAATPLPHPDPIAFGQDGKTWAWVRPVAIGLGQEVGQAFMAREGGYQIGLGTLYLAGQMVDGKFFFVRTTECAKLPGVNVHWQPGKNPKVDPGWVRINDLQHMG